MLFQTSIPDSFLRAFDLDITFMDKLDKLYSNQGWYNFFDDISVEEVESSLSSMSRDVDYILSIGVGGSYIGIRALVEFMGQEDKWIFLGASLDAQEISSIKEKLQGKKIGVLVISKSGQTFEINLFLSLFYPFIKEAAWISVISSSKLFYQDMKKKLGREAYFYPIEEKTGGRYSLFGLMGLVVLYLMGEDWKGIVGLIKEEKQKFKSNFIEHPAFKRGVGRYLLQSLYGVSIEFLSIKERKLEYSIKWLEQLFAESDGKEGKGLYIGRAFYPQDAHSIGQIMAQGKRVVAETFYLLENNESSDVHLSFSLGKDSQVDSLQELGNIFIAGIIEDRQCKHVITQSYLIPQTMVGLYKVFFYEMLAVSLECYLLGVNPFNQPGVEGYKACIKNKVKQV